MSMIQSHETLVQTYSDDMAFEDLEVDKERSDYKSIRAIETELSAYRRGAIRVRIDFDKNMIFWKDSRQWNNNFFRSVPPHRMSEFLQALPAMHLLEWNRDGAEGSAETYPACTPSNWMVTIYFEDESAMKFSGQNSYPREWKQFKELIEGMARIPFCLR